MTGKYVAWPQLLDDFAKTLTAVRERDSENRKIDIFYPRVQWRARNASGIDVNSFAAVFDHERERLTHTPIRRFDRQFFALAWRWWTSIERNLSEKPVVLRRKSTNRPRPDFAYGPLFDDLTSVRRNAERLNQSNLGWSGDESSIRAPHDFGSVKQMIKMRVRDEEHVCARANMSQTFIYAIGI